MRVKLNPFLRATCRPRLLTTALLASGAIAVTGAAPALAAPPAPTNVHVVAVGTTQVALAWSKPTGGESITGYEVLREGARAGTTDQYTTRFLDAASGLEAGKHYRYTVVSLQRSEKSAPSTPALELETAGSATPITECSSHSTGHYVLTGNLSYAPGHKCLAFESAEGVSLDCQHHSITGESGAGRREEALVLANVKHFLVVNCNFSQPDPQNQPNIVSTSNSSEGVFARDTFAAAQEWVQVLSNTTTAVAYESDLMTNVVLRTIKATEGYIGYSVITEPSQSLIGTFGLEPTSRKNVVDHNVIDGDSMLTGYPSTQHTYEPPIRGADDTMNLTSAREDEIVNNRFDNDFDCGLESADLVEKEKIVGNVFDNSWAAAICSYVRTSWLEDTISNNTAWYSGLFWALAGSSEHSIGENARGEWVAEPGKNHLARNTFEANAQAGWEWHIWDYGATMTPWNEPAVQEVESNNNFLRNNFGEAAPAPYINAVLPENDGGLRKSAKEAGYPPLAEPHIIGSQNENECSETVYLTCTKPKAVPVQAPQVAGVYPPQGPESAGTQVVVEGSGFTGANEVKFGGASVTAPHLRVLSDTRVIAEAPAHTGEGAVSVTVHTPAGGTSEVLGGSGPVASADQYTYGPFPVVTSLSPAAGPPPGGTKLTISGSGFTGATTVKFGPLAEESCAKTGEKQPCFTVRSDASIAATSLPDQEHLTYQNVIVTTPSGTSTVTEGVLMEPPGVGVDDEFTYATITAVEPSSAPAAGGTRVIIKGEDLFNARESLDRTQDESIKFGEKTVPINDVELKSNSEVVVLRAPAGNGTVDVTISRPGGSTAITPADHYTYLAWPGYSFGSNSSSQLGDGESPSHQASSPVPVPVKEGGAGLPGVAALAGGEGQSYALRANGTVRAWGSNSSEQLGDGETSEKQKESPSAVPVVEPAGREITGAESVAAGFSHGLAVVSKEGGEVLAWGSNADDQLGDGRGSGEQHSSDVAVPVCTAPEPHCNPLRGVVSVAAGGNHSLALLRNGAIYAWGENRFGQVGDGTTENRDYAVLVGGNGIAIAAGAYHSLASVSAENGWVWDWGRNSSGQLGNGENKGPETCESGEPCSKGPRPINLHEVVAVAGGEAHSLALLQSGKVKAWGKGSEGQLGNDETLEKNQPVAVCAPGATASPCEELSGVTAIAAGANHSLAVLKSTMVNAWGLNSSGQLGNDTTKNSTLPVVVCAVAENPCKPENDFRAAATVAGGTADSLVNSGPAVSAISPSSGPESGGTSVTISGSHLAGATEVKFGQTKALSAVVNSESSVTATAPPGASIVDVTVTTPDGTSQTSAGDRFEYLIAPLYQGLPFATPIEAGKETTLNAPKEGSFSFGPLKVTGSVGEEARLELKTQGPAFEEIGPGEYKSTGKGVVTSVEGRNPSGEHLIGPLTVACKVPRSSPLATIPIHAEASGKKTIHTLVYFDECVLAPGVINEKGTVTVRFTYEAPETVTPGEEVEVTGASFSITVPKSWTEQLYSLGGREARGTSGSTTSTAVMEG
jgi:alpha-tubulin suppressor-like RCC1 family protein